MWKPGHRLAADRRGLRYPSDLTDAAYDGSRRLASAHEADMSMTARGTFSAQSATTRHRPQANDAAELTKLEDLTSTCG